MLAFIVPLKSKKTCTSWENVSRLFERCVKSICHQTTDNFQVIVVCNEKPEIQFTHHKITYIEQEFPLPSTDLYSKDMDRTRKVITGFLYAQKIKSSHIMCVDADDCVSKHIAKFVNSYPQADGWFFKQGYVYYENSQLIRIMRKGFDSYCGTSNIVRTDLYQIPETLNESDEIEYRELIYNHYRHREIIGTLAKKGATLASLPFPGAIYTCNGENIYHGVKEFKKKINLKIRLLRIKALFDSRWINASLRDEFQLYDVIEGQGRNFLVKM
jgi:glycosyltransferase involved in cell wall biosynthesis